MLLACACWGVMAPLAKDAMTHGLDGFSMVTLRVSGAALLFWLTTCIINVCKCARKQTIERVPWKDVGRLFLASLIGVTCNQCCFTIGVSYTSPIHATLMTTTLPVISLLLGIIFFGEKATLRKVLGITLGLGGAATLILSSGSLSGGNLLGDMLCIVAQCSFATYLVTFRKFIRKYSVLATMRWMMLFATLTVLPMTFPHLMATEWLAIPAKTYWETAYTVFVGTYLCYILMTFAQKGLRPTEVAMYNYVQPIVSTIVSLVLGVAIFGWHQALAVVLIFTGVYLVSVTRKKKSNNSTV